METRPNLQSASHFTTWRAHAVSVILFSCTFIIDILIVFSMVTIIDWAAPHIKSVSFLEREKKARVTVLQNCLRL